MHFGRRRNDAETETAARVIAAAAFRSSSLLAARLTRLLLTRGRARIHGEIAKHIGHAYKLQQR